MTTPMQRFLREPLLHFLVLGVMIFVLYSAVSDAPSRPTNTIVIGPARIAQLSQSYEAAWLRPPSADELNGIIDDAIREEVYYREAIALGLDTNDTIVRRRLRQKMEFLTDSGAGLLEPVAGELEAHLKAQQVIFRLPPRLAFEQIYLGEQANPEYAVRLLHELQADPIAEASSLGEPTMLPARLGLSPPQAIDAMFGQGFFKVLAELPREVWSGPVESAFGLHLARIEDSVAPRLPELAEIRGRVLRDWRATKASQLRELHYARLRERYAVEIRHPSESEAPERR